MAVNEHTGELLSFARWNLRSRTFGLMTGVMLAIAAVGVGVLVYGGEANAMHGASTLVLLSASLVFAIYYAAAPLSRLIRADVTRVLGEARLALAYGFAGMIAVFTACILTPDYMSGARIPLPSLAFAGMTALVCAVFMVSAGSKRVDQSVTLRTLRGLSSGYFWLVFIVSDIDHMVGPHRPDNNPYGLSLLLLVLALIVRFADAFVLRIKADMSERTV